MAYTPDVSMFPYWTRDDNKELYDLREFKNRAEDTCASHVVMEDLMKQVASLQEQLKDVKIQCHGKEILNKSLYNENCEYLAALKDNDFSKCGCCEKWGDSDGWAHVSRDWGGDENWCEECVSEETMECDECGILCCTDEISMWSPEDAEIDEDTGMPWTFKEVCFECERRLEAAS